MALVVETGTGDPAAESYVSVAGADTYHSDRANTAWAALGTSAKEAALRKAAEYMANAYRERWSGYRKTVTQALDWPRYMVPFKDAPGSYTNVRNYYDDSSVPVLVARACAELALRASAGDLTPDLSPNVVKETVGPISVEYDPGSPEFVRFRQVDLMLEPLFAIGGGGLRVVRA